MSIGMAILTVGLRALAVFSPGFRGLLILGILIAGGYVGYLLARQTGASLLA